MLAKSLRGFLIDPEAKTITKVSHNGDYRQIYEFIKCDTFTVVQIGDGNMVLVDDNGLLNDPRYFFTIDRYHQPLAGRGLVLGCDEAGETVGTSLELEDLQKIVGFVELSVQGWQTTEENDVEIMPGIKGFRISNVPIFGLPKKESDNG